MMQPGDGNGVWAGLGYSMHEKLMSCLGLAILTTCHDVHGEEVGCFKML